MIDPDPRLEHIRLGDLVVDLRVQRVTQQSHVDELVRDFDRAAMGALILSKRPDGSLHIIDGGHRWAASVIVLGKDATVPAVIHEHLTEAEEASLFLALNHVRNVKPLQKWPVRVVAGDPVAKGMEAVVVRTGWRIGAGGRDGIAAVSALESLYLGRGVPGARRGHTFPDALESALLVARDAWGFDDRDARNGHILQAIGSVFIKYPGLSRARMVKALSSQGSANKFYAAMKGRVSGTHNGLYKAGTVVAINLCNKGYQEKNRLSQIFEDA